MDLPARDAVVSAFLQEVVRFVDREISPRVARLQEEIRKSGDTPANRNKLGVLYAQYGLYDEARAQLTLAAAKSGYAPPLVNLGNVEYLAGDARKAIDYYEKAKAFLPSNPALLSSLAKACRAAGDETRYASTMTALASLDATAAAKLAGEGETGRAAEAGELEVDSWAE